MSASPLPPHISPGLFITGTDTGCGKTRVAAGILHRLNQRGVSAVGMKPVASGCLATPDGLRNDDALSLQSVSSPRPRYDDINPYAFEPPIAPHVAAQEAGSVIDRQVIRTAYERLAGTTERMVVEGVGGWAVPLGSDFTLADLVRELRLPVVLVVGLRLGCLNHAQLAARAIADDGCELAGWIANAVDPAFERPGANLMSLKQLLHPTPCLGVVDHHPAPTPEAVAKHLRFDRLVEAMGAATPEA